MPTTRPSARACLLVNDGTVLLTMLRHHDRGHGPATNLAGPAMDTPRPRNHRGRGQDLIKQRERMPGLLHG